MKTHQGPIITALLTVIWTATAGTGDTYSQTLNAPHVEGRLLVRLSREALRRPGGDPVTASSLAAAVGETVRALRVLPWTSGRTATRNPLLKRMFRLEFPSGTDLSGPLSRLRSDPRVELASPDYIFPVESLPGEYQPSLHWALERVGAADIWEYTSGGAGVLVGIVDTGVEWHHPDLIGNIWINPGEDTDGQARSYLLDPSLGYRDFLSNYGNDKDDDGDDKVDNLIGWDFVDLPSIQPVAPNEDRAIEDNNPDDFDGHGTKVSGIVGAVGDNDYSNPTLGIAWDCDILPLRAGYKDQNGQGRIVLSSATSAIFYAVEAGADIINLSFAAPDSSYFAFMRTAIDSARAHGIIVVAAAGRVGSETEPNYPAAFSGVVAVGATDRDDRLVEGTASGDWLDLVAPGYEIYSTDRGGGDDYATGTSMAAPLVSGAAALLRELYPDSSSGWIAAKLTGTCDNVDDRNPGLRGLLGGGRLNVRRAIIGAFQPDLSVSGISSINDSLTLGAMVADGRIDPGETATITVALSNHYLGQEAAGVEAKILSAPAGITLLDSVSVYGNIAPGEMREPSDRPFKISASEQMEAREVVLPLTLSAGAGDYLVADSISIWIGRPSTLLLALDGSGGIPHVYRAAGDSLNTPMEIRELSPDDSLAISDVSNYTTMIMAIGAGEDSLFHTGRTRTMIEYLLAGGNLLLITGNCFPVGEPFLSLFLNCRPDPDSSLVPGGIVGIGGDPISRDLQFDIDPQQLCRQGFHRLQPLDDAVAFLNYQGETSAAGVRYEDNEFSDYRSAVIAFGLEAIIEGAEGFGQGTLLLQRTVDWLAETSSIGTATTAEVGGKPEGLRLEQNYPNPFNISTRIRFRIDRTEPISLRLYNMNGHLIKTLLDQELPPGEHIVSWDGFDNDNNPSPSGVYFLRLQAGRRMRVRKVVLLK